MLRTQKCKKKLKKPHGVNYFMLAKYGSADTNDSKYDFVSHHRVLLSTTRNEKDYTRDYTRYMYTITLILFFNPNPNNSANPYPDSNLYPNSCSFCNSFLCIPLQCFRRHCLIVPSLFASLKSLAVFSRTAHQHSDLCSRRSHGRYWHTV